MSVAVWSNFREVVIGFLCNLKVLSLPKTVLNSTSFHFSFCVKMLLTLHICLIFVRIESCMADLHTFKQVEVRFCNYLLLTELLNVRL